MTHKNTNHIPFLQLLRALAAIAVMIYHRKAWLVISGVQRGEKIFGSAPLAVDLFFIMSGLVLTLSLFRMDMSKPWQACKKFFIDRIVRIRPMRFAATLSRALFLEPRSRFTQLSRWKELWKALFFIPLNFYASAPYYGYSKLLIGWTMHYEILVYILLLPCIFLWKRRASLVLSLLLITIFFLTHPIIFTQWISLHILRDTLNPYIHSFQFGNILNFLTNPLVLEFTVGIALAYLYQSNINFPKILSFLLLFTGIAVLFLQIQEFRRGGHGLAQRGLGCSFLILWGVMLHKAKPLSIHPLRERWGKLSYSIYLTHLIIQELFSHHLVPLFPSITGPIRLLLSSVCVLWISYITWFYIEQRFWKWLKEKLNLIF